MFVEPRREASIVDAQVVSHGEKQGRFRGE